ncbi:MAG: uracil phosphoribosyltransferase [Alistipes sp.]|nr:uracil phosphoribosyltransferase [Alistipes sp.]
MLHILDQQPSLVNSYLRELRDSKIQLDSMRFRRNIERVGEIMAYEISKTLNVTDVDVTTQLGTATVASPSDKIVLATVLRAGLPLHQGLLNSFDGAENAFVSAYRVEDGSDTLTIKVEYISCPKLEGKVLILADTMLATGMSMVAAYRALVARGGEPLHTHFVSVLGCTQGTEYLQANIPSERCTVWVATVDKELNPMKYIVPGLGDAGDLCYGEKL